MAVKSKAIYICSQCGYESANGTENVVAAANVIQ